jgi:hypothetical protein
MNNFQILEFLCMGAIILITKHEYYINYNYVRYILNKFIITFYILITQFTNMSFFLGNY